MKKPHAASTNRSARARLTVGDEEVAALRAGGVGATATTATAASNVGTASAPTWYEVAWSRFVSGASFGA